MTALLVLLAGASAAAGAEIRRGQAEPAQHLTDVRTPGRFVLQGGAAGEVFGWDAQTRTLARWDRKGELVSACTLPEALLPGRPSYTFAGAGDAVFLSFFDFAVGSEMARRQVVVDLARCRIEGTFTVDGVVSAAAAAPDGWLLTIGGPDPTGSARVGFFHVTRRGEAIARLEVGSELDVLLKQARVAPTAATREGRMLSVGRWAWMVPNGAYAFFRPKQHGVPSRSVSPPGCLAATAREITGEENAELVAAAAKLFPERIRSMVEGSIQHGTLGSTFTRATRGLASFRNLVAVQVTDDRVGGGARIDLWDMLTESLVAIVPIPATLGLLAVNDEYAWVTEEDARVRKLDLPPLVTPLADPCAAHAALRGRPAGKTAPTPNPRGAAAL